MEKIQKNQLVTKKSKSRKNNDRSTQEGRFWRYANSDNPYYRNNSSQEFSAAFLASGNFFDLKKPEAFQIEPRIALVSALYVANLSAFGEFANDPLTIKYEEPFLANTWARAGATFGDQTFQLKPGQYAPARDFSKKPDTGGLL